MIAVCYHIKRLMELIEFVWLVIFLIPFIVCFFIIKYTENIKNRKVKDLNYFILKKKNEVNENNNYELKHIEGLELKKEEIVYAKILDDKLEIETLQRKYFLNFDKIKAVDYDVKEKEYEDIVLRNLVKHIFFWSELKILYTDNDNDVRKILFIDKNFTIENSKEFIKKSFFYCKYLGKALEDKINN